MSTQHHFNSGQSDFNRGRGHANNPNLTAEQRKAYEAGREHAKKSQK